MGVARDHKTMDMMTGRFWERLLFEAPGPLVVTLVLVALVLFVLAHRRNSVRLLVGAGLVLMVAGGLWLLAWLVTTPAERLAGQVRRLVALTAPYDRAGVQALLAEDVELTGPRGQVWLKGRALRVALDRAAQMYPIRQQSLAGVGVTMLSDHAAESSLKVVSVPAKSDYFDTVRTSWTLVWQRAPEGAWKVQRIQWERFQGQAPNESLIPK